MPPEACSGSLVSLDVACRYLQSREISGAIVAGANLYLSPEHVMDSKSNWLSRTSQKKSDMLQLVQ